MRVDHGRAHVAVSEQFLDGAPATLAECRSPCLLNQVAVPFRLRVLLPPVASRIELSTGRDSAGSDAVAGGAGGGVDGTQEA